MGNFLKELLDAAEINKAISERQRIIDQYRYCRWLDREAAIQKIRELRLTDEDVRQMTEVSMVIGGLTPFTECSDEQLVRELDMQISLLRAKIGAKTVDGSADN